MNNPDSQLLSLRKSVLLVKYIYVIISECQQNCRRYCKEGGKCKGIRIIIKLKFQNRAAEITVQPTSSSLIIKYLGEYERDRKKVKNFTHKGDLSLEQFKKIAKVIGEKFMCKTFTSTVKQIPETCFSIVCTVDKRNPKKIIEKITNAEINV